MTAKLPERAEIDTEAMRLWRAYAPSQLRGLLRARGEGLINKTPAMFTFDPNEARDAAGKWTGEGAEPPPHEQAKRVHYWVLANIAKWYKAGDPGGEGGQSYGWHTYMADAALEAMHWHISSDEPGMSYRTAEGSRYYEWVWQHIRRVAYERGYLTDAAVRPEDKKPATFGYDPSEPRKPKGSKGGGQWTSSHGGTVDHAVGAVAAEIRKYGHDPAMHDAKNAYEVLDDLARTEPELLASEWHREAPEKVLKEFDKAWVARFPTKPKPPLFKFDEPKPAAPAAKAEPAKPAEIVYEKDKYYDYYYPKGSSQEWQRNWKGERIPPSHPVPSEERRRKIHYWIKANIAGYIPPGHEPETGNIGEGWHIGVAVKALQQVAWSEAEREANPNNPGAPYLHWAWEQVYAIYRELGGQGKAYFAMRDVTSERRIPRGMEHGGEWTSTAVATQAAATEPGQYETVEQAQAAMMELFPWIKVDFTGLDLVNVNPTTVAMVKMAKMYPEAMRTLLSVRADTDRARTGGGVYAVTASDTVFSKPVSDIYLNPKFYGDKSLSSHIALDIMAGWHPKKTNGAGSIFIHEFGHVLDNYMSNEHIYLWDIATARARHKGISNYAKRNHREAVAEVFTAMTMNPDDGELGYKTNGLGTEMEAVLAYAFPQHVPWDGVPWPKKLPKSDGEYGPTQLDLQHYEVLTKRYGVK